MRTSDGFDVEWSPLRTEMHSCTLSAAQLLACRDGETYARALAHASVTDAQMFDLYGRTAAMLDRGKRWRIMGRRIREIERTCKIAPEAFAGIPLSALYSILALWHKDRDQGALLRNLAAGAPPRRDHGNGKKGRPRGE